MSMPWAVATALIAHLLILWTLPTVNIVLLCGQYTPLKDIYNFIHKIFPQYDIYFNELSNGNCEIANGR